MSIKVQCPNPACGKVFSVKPEYAGRKAKCPGCSSPLIIPIPEGGGAFDFGSLGESSAAAAPPAESANPFAFEAAPPPAPTAKPKPVKKPAATPVPEAGNPFAAPIAAPAAPRVAPPVAPPIAVAEPIAEPSLEDAPAVVVHPEPLVAPLGGDFTSIADSSSAPPPLPPEPWYYGFLSGYAKVVMILGLILAGLALLSGVVYGALNLQFNAVVGIALMVGGILYAAIIALTTLIGVAFILLVVDAARNLREIRRQTKR